MFKPTLLLLVPFLTARVEAAASSTETPPKKLAVGTEGLFQPSLLLQGWFLADRADETSTTFRIRRAEIGAKGELIPKLIAYGVMFDPAKVLEPQNKAFAVENQDPAATDPDAPEQVTVKQPVSATSVFQDLFITFQSPWVDASIGQFKIPVSLEGNSSSSKLLFAERAAVAREFGDKRDMGLRLTKAFQYWGYSVGIFNGTTLNNLDTNNEKDAAMRLEGYPIEGLTLAGVAYATVGDRENEGVKDRYEGDLRFERGPFLAQAEYIFAHDKASGGEATDAQGFYAALGTTLFQRIQPCMRVGFLKDALWHYDFGVNYYLRKHEAKLQLNYFRQQFEDKTPNNEVIFAAQIGF